MPREEIEFEPPRENLDPNMVRNYHLAAEVYQRIGDDDNANQLYRDISRNDLIREAGERKRIDPNVEKILRKIARWLTVEDTWSKQALGYERFHDFQRDLRLPEPAPSDMLYGFDFTYEPEFKEFGNVENFYNTVRKELRLFEVETERQTDNPYERITRGFQLASYDKWILVLKHREADIWNKERIKPVVPEDFRMPEG